MPVLIGGRDDRYGAVRNRGTPMGQRERHDAVAAYALGVLEPADALCCERHLTACGPCAARLGEFAGAAAALAQLAGREPLEPRPVRPVPWPGRRAPRRRGRLVAVAAALAVALPGGALVLARDGGDPAVWRVTAADPATGADAALETRDREWGTEVAVRVAGVRAPRVCELVVVGTDGSAWRVLGWAVTPGDDPVVRGATALRRDEIARFEVRAADGRRLVSLAPRP
ncbi:zf-HC2 domain-containing protein [Streptomyces sp. NPDC047928]|uniref:zf-HC2 domain-containing protein n=1 Tax=unclassified Streptomyces TaxID=2593676 RepID=UPI0037225569